MQSPRGRSPVCPQDSRSVGIQSHFWLRSRCSPPWLAGQATQETLLQTNRAVSHSLEVITSVQAILSSLQDIETGSRGFILTGDASYLEPYERGLNQLEGYRRAWNNWSKAAAIPTSAGSARWMQPSPNACRWLPAMSRHAATPACRRPPSACAAPAATC